MTLLLLLFGTISDVFVVRATWPIVRYKNGTVGVKNDGGTVKVQSTDLIVDGNLSVSGSLFIQDRDLAEYEDRVSFLETALGDPALLNLSNCSSVTYRSPTAYPKEATEWDYLSIPSVVSGTTQFSLSWTDIKSICTHKGYILCSSETFCTNYVPPSALDIPEHDSWIAVGDSENEWLTFRRGWNNRICKTHTEVAGSKPSWGTSNFTGTTGDMYRAGLCCSVGDTSESMCTSNDNNTTTSVVSQLQSLTPPKCMPPGGDKLRFDGRSWICGCADGWTGDDCGTFEGIQDFHVSDAWFRSPFLSESSSLPTISTISAYLSNMTTCRRDIHSIDYKDCANPDSDWREARITFQSSFSIKTLLADGCGLTSGEGKNTGVCMSWRCDSSICGGDDPFYAKGQTMLIASEKFYRLERDFSYALQTWLLGTAQVFIQSKSTREIVKLTNSDMTTDRPAWSSNYVETAYAKFDIQETGDYRVIVSLKADNEEGAMFNLMSIEKSFMGSNDLSKFFFAYGTYSGCQYVCPYVGDEQVCDGVENTGCDYYR